MTRRFSPALIGALVLGAGLSFPPLTAPVAQSVLFRNLPVAAGSPTPLLPPSPSGPAPVPAPAVATPAPAPAVPPALPTRVQDRGRSYAQAAGPPTVRVRGASHPDYGRLVFDWTGPVAYRVTRAGDAIEIRFDRPARADLTGLPADTLRNVGRLTQSTDAGGLVLRVQTPPGVRTRDLRSGPKVVVDFLDPVPGAQDVAPVPAAGAPAPAALPPVPAPSAVPSAAPPAAPAVTPTVPPAVRPPGAVPAVGAAAQPEPSAPDRPILFGRIPVPPAKPANPGAAAPEAPAAGPAAPATTAGAPAPSGPAPADQARSAPVLVFKPGQPVAAAAVQRGGRLILVFDGTLPVTAGRVQDDPNRLIGSIEPVPAAGGSAFQVMVPSWLQPAVERSGSDWLIRFVPDAVAVRTAPPIESQPDFPIGARLLIRADDADKVVEVGDPESGDSLLVVPLPTPGQAMDARREFSQLEIVPTLQGIVVQPRADGVFLRAVREGLEITAAGGLRLSPAADTAQARAADPPRVSVTAAAALAQTKPNGGNTPRLFDFVAWQKGPAAQFTQFRQSLQNAVVDAPASGRNRARIDLARFYLAHGYFHEARGLLGVMVAAEPDLEGWPEFRAMRGVAALGAGAYDAGLADLSIPALKDNPEAVLWRSWAAAWQRDFTSAAAGFTANDRILASYPEPHFSRLGFKAADSLLQIGKKDAAGVILDRTAAKLGAEIEETPAMRYLRGEYWRQAGEPDEAIGLLKLAAESNDRFYRARAGLALVDLELENGAITPATAAERMAKMRFAWRGDVLERDIIRRQGEIQWLAGSFGDGLDTLREAAMLSPQGTATSIGQKMTALFAELYRDGARKMPPIEAINLYDRYRELTPVGVAGDEVIRQLAERLVELDLLPRAAELLQHQMQYRLRGEDKAQVGTRLAAIHLLDGKPQSALKALDESETAGLQGELVRDRRLLRAKAVTGLGRSEEAMAILAEDTGPAANLLRVEIAWRNRNWGAAAAALDRVIGGPPPAGAALDPQVADLVVDRAVALALAGDLTALDGLRQRFGPAMETGPRAAAFAVLTRPDQAAGTLDLESIKSRVAEVDVFQKFLRSVRAAPPAANKS